MHNSIIIHRNNVLVKYLFRMFSTLLFASKTLFFEKLNKNVFVLINLSFENIFRTFVLNIHSLKYCLSNSLSYLLIALKINLKLICFKCG